MIDINGLTKNYNNLLTLNNLKLKIEDGEIYGMPDADLVDKTNKYQF